MLIVPARKSVSSAATYDEKRVSTRGTLKSGISPSLVMIAAACAACLVLSFLALHHLALVSAFGRSSLVLAASGFGLLGLGIAAVSPMMTKYVAIVVLLASAIIALYLSTAPLYNPLAATTRGAQLVVIACVVFVCARVGIAMQVERFLFPSGILATILLLALAAGAAAAGFTPPWTAGLQNPNALGMAGFTLFFFALAFSVTRTKQVRLLLVPLAFALSVVVVISSGSRASLAALLVAWGAYFVWPLITVSRVSFWIWILGLAGGVSLATAIISGYISVGWISDADAFSREYLGKRLMSGRDQVWPDVARAIAERPIFGWGGGVMLDDIADWSFSAHNLYLQVALQLGLFGMMLLLVILALVWRGLWDGRRDHTVRICAAYFSGMLILQTFEVTLTQNNLAFGLPFWCFVGLALGISHRSMNAQKALGASLWSTQEMRGT